jgi:copper homeostasis protein
MTLEICANSMHSALIAQNAGAHRVELCENLNEGGTTPSFGTISETRKHLHISLFVLIRPRSGDFLYTKEEFEIMKADIEMCKTIGCDGVVIGLLTKEGEVDYERTQELVKLASPMRVTFHRAFDRCKDPFKALEVIINTGCERILTSGLKSSALEASDLIKKLVEKAGNRISIMPGAGINSTNILDLKKIVNAKEYHSSAKSNRPSLMNHLNPELGDDKIQLQISDGTEIKKMLAQLR